MKTITQKAGVRLFVKLFLEGSAVSSSFLLAYLLRFDGRVPDSFRPTALAVLPLLIAIRLASNYAVTRYRLHWRFTSLIDAAYILEAVALGSVGFAGSLALLALPSIPKGVILLEALLTFQFFLAARLAIRVAWNSLTGRRSPRNGSIRRVLVVGAGDGGQRIVREMKEDRIAHLKPVGFVDDDPLKRNRMIHGVRVFGTTAEIVTIVEDLAVDQILIAIPSASGERIREIVRSCAEARAELTILPSLPELLNASPSTGTIRKVNVEDLLHREPVRIDMESIAAYTSGKRILVTGAGGSIGSELCRQLVAFNPAQMVLLGQDENSLYWIDQELKADYGYTPLMVVADIKDRLRLDDVYRRHRPEVVFHAAAHKHVPLMEANPAEAVKNNVFGTKNLAELAVAYGVKKFVMISTDKAVNPTSVMGASKRIAEMVVQSLAQRIEDARRGGRPATFSGFGPVSPREAVTRFSSVRFGNVLGSNGSVIPTMRRQIERGGPVRVTHEEMVRFFMTIPEAVQLVIQAGGMGRGGEIFVLDMGDPVKIIDLAWNFVRLSGFVPDVDIKIEITGMRPGEKLYEEVLTAEEGTRVTGHEKILVAKASEIRHEHLVAGLDRLEDAARVTDEDAVRRLLRELVPTFRGRVPAPLPEPVDEGELDRERHEDNASELAEAVV